MLGESSNIFVHYKESINLDNVIPVRYESLVEDARFITLDVFSKITNEDYRNLEFDHERVNQRTKGSNNPKFFWKSKSGTRHEYFTTEQLHHFAIRYSRELSAMGYSQE